MLLVGCALMAAASACAQETFPAQGPADAASAFPSVSASPTAGPSASATAVPLGSRPSSSPSSSPTSPAPLTVDPLTGRTPVPRGSVVAVKIDNAPSARPYWRGLDQASLVYQELVEGGASRFLAVFAPATASEVGPVRSVRANDLELVRQFGRIALASTGANTGVLATVAQAAREGQLLDAGFDVVPGPYRKAGRRQDAFNFFTSPAAIDRATPGGVSVQDVGLRFGALPPGAGTPAARASARFSRLTHVHVRYQPERGSYAVFQGGDRMPDFAPTNIVVQSVSVVPGAYVDVGGDRTPYTRTVGTGRVDLLRDGRRLSGTWRRPDAEAGTRLRDAAGRDLPLKPGSTLVLLLPADRSLQVG